MRGNEGYRLKWLWCTAASLSAGFFMGQAEAAVCPSDRTYTLNADFDEGTLNNVNHDIADQLQLNAQAEGFPYIWVAESNIGRVVRIHTKTRLVEGEYRTAPETSGFPSPSRTTVDLMGNCWLTNRSDDSNACRGGIPTGSVTRIGLIIGGTRVNPDGTANPNGDCLAPPYDYNTCMDRPGAPGPGLICTSRGLGDTRDWMNVGAPDTCGGVTTAQDECVINYTRVVGTGTRTIAIDSNNDVWVGGMFGAGPNHEHEKLSGITGLPIPGTQFNIGCGGYGGFIDCNDVLWSSSQCSGAGLMRYDTTTGIGQCLLNRGDYGLGYDIVTGHVWQSSLCQNPMEVFELDTDGSVINSYPQPFGAQGVTVDLKQHVWVAEIFGDEVLHLAPNPGPGSYVVVGTVPGFAGTTGVATDGNNKVWATETGDRVSVIDKTLGPPGGGGFTVGGIEQSIPLTPGSGPYNYSDMTGLIGLGAASNGSWTVVRDGGKPGIEWGTVTWNTEDCASPHEPAGTSLTVEIRAADSQIGLSSALYMTVDNGVKFSGVFGQFIEIRVTFSGTSATACGTGEFGTPVLCDLTVEAQCDDAGIPTVSEWGVVAMTLLLLTAWKVQFGHRRARLPTA